MSNRERICVVSRRVESTMNALSFMHSVFKAFVYADGEGAMSEDERTDFNIGFTELLEKECVNMAEAFSEIDDCSVVGECDLAS